MDRQCHTADLRSCQAFLKSFAEGVQGLVPALLSEHMPGGYDERDGPLNEL
jgi:hypothetical protein